MTYFYLKNFFEMFQKFKKMISRAATRIELKHDDDMHELDDPEMQKLRASKRTEAQQMSNAFLA